MAAASGMPGTGLTEVPRRQALSDRLALKPYWGKLNVRNFRGGDGDVGIIRSPVRAITLPDRVSVSEDPLSDAGRAIQVVHTRSGRDHGWGSVDSTKCSTLCGARPNARQMRLIDV